MPHSDNGGSLAREAWDLIPWVANGRASQEERQRVEEHVRDCQDCADELAFQRRLQRALAGEPERIASPEPALRDLLQRIDEADRPAVPLRRSRFSASRLPQALLVPGLVGAVLLEACAIALLVGISWMQTPHNSATTPGFQTLTTEASAPRAASLRVVFAGGMPMEEVQRLLTSLHLQIVGGPTAADALTLGSDGTGSVSTTAALAALRRNPSVRFAEPVDAPAP